MALVASLEQWDDLNAGKLAITETPAKPERIGQAILEPYPFKLVRPVGIQVSNRYGNSQLTSGLAPASRDKNGQEYRRWHRAWQKRAFAEKRPFQTMTNRKHRTLGGWHQANPSGVLW